MQSEPSVDGTGSSLDAIAGAFMEAFMEALFPNRIHRLYKKSKL